MKFNQKFVKFKTEIVKKFLKVLNSTLQLQFNGTISV